MKCTPELLAHPKFLLSATAEITGGLVGGKAARPGSAKDVGSITAAAVWGPPELTSINRENLVAYEVGAKVTAKDDVTGEEFLRERTISGILGFDPGPQSPPPLDLDMFVESLEYLDYGRPRNFDDREFDFAQFIPPEDLDRHPDFLRRVESVIRAREIGSEVSGLNESGKQDTGVVREVEFLGAVKLNRGYPGRDPENLFHWTASVRYHAISATSEENLANSGGGLDGTLLVKWPNHLTDTADLDKLANCLLITEVQDGDWVGAT